MIENFLANIGLDHPLWLIVAVAAIVVVSVAIGVAFNNLIFPIILRLAQWLPSGGNGPGSMARASASSSSVPALVRASVPT